MKLTYEEFLELYEEYFIRYKTDYLLSVDAYNEFMSLISLGFSKLGYNEMMDIKPKMDEIKEKYFKGE